MSNIVCSNCGKVHPTTDTVGRYYFESASFPLGSLASPADIAGVAETMTFCPSCEDKGLEHLSDTMGREEKEKTRKDPDGLDGEGTDGPGTPTSTHGTPPSHYGE